jgi:hypothetical protein
MNHSPFFNEFQLLEILGKRLNIELQIQFEKAYNAYVQSVAKTAHLSGLKDSAERQKNAKAECQEHLDALNNTLRQLKIEMKKINDSDD